MRFLIPTGPERRHLGRFYLSSFIGEMAHLAMPFQVLLVIRYTSAPMLGVLLFVEGAMEMLGDLPSSAWADRFSRKSVVLAGHVVAALGWLAIPAATLLAPTPRAIGFGVAFGLLGFGSALVAGTFDAWVVDNLHAEKQSGLSIYFFGRERSVASAGGLIADVLAAGLVLLFHWDIRWFWLVTAAGELAAGAILWRTPEIPAPDDGEEPEDEADDPVAEPGSWREALNTVKKGVAVVRQRPALFAFTLMLIWATVTVGVWPEGFQTALAQGRLSDWAFPALEFVVDLIGVLAPLTAIGLSRRLGSRNVLASMIWLGGGLAVALWFAPALLVIVVIYLINCAILDVFDTAADDYEQALIPSATRATTTSALGLLHGFAGLASAGFLSLLLLFHTASSALALLGVLSLPAALLLFWRPRNGGERPTPSEAPR